MWPWLSSLQQERRDSNQEDAQGIPTVWQLLLSYRTIAQNKDFQSLRTLGRDSKITTTQNSQQIFFIIQRNCSGEGGARWTMTYTTCLLKGQWRTSKEEREEGNDVIALWPQQKRNNYKKNLHQIDSGAPGNRATTWEAGVWVDRYRMVGALGFCD